MVLRGMICPPHLNLGPMNALTLLVRYIEYHPATSANLHPLHILLHEYGQSGKIGNDWLGITWFGSHQECPICRDVTLQCTLALTLIVNFEYGTHCEK